MKAALAFLALTACLHAQSPVVISQPTPQATVVSPLTTSTAQTNQALLNQINSTISQRAFQHQVLTLPQPVPTSVSAPVIRVK
jgi:uncharacterized membrane protein YgcG